MLDALNRIIDRELGLEEYTQLEIYLTWPLMEPQPLVREVDLVYRPNKIEEKDPITKFIDAEFGDLSGYSARQITGWWGNAKEYSTVITHLCPTIDAVLAYERFMAIAEKYKKEFNQTCVLLTVSSIKVKFV